jgi:hypothetical protein
MAETAARTARYGLRHGAQQSKKQLSGIVAVFSGDYPSTSEQLQGLKVARFHNLSVSACVVSSDGERPSMYWIAALAY